jgi:hypothetical protein
LKVFLGALDGIEESEFKREDTRESINKGLAHAKPVESGLTVP